MTYPTERQATQALAALDNLVNRCESYRQWGGYDDLQYQWEKEALFRLRGFLIAAGARLPVADDVTDE